MTSFVKIDLATEKVAVSYCMLEVTYMRLNLYPTPTLPNRFGVKLRTSNKDKFYIGVCYRTPSASIFQIDTHSALRELISTTATSGNHFILMGDFNYPFSRWPPHPDIDGLDRNAKEFCSCLEDNFLYQHIVLPTRKDNILDLVLTDEPHMISDICDLGPLASGDHHALRWKLHVNTVPDETTRYVFDYGRLDLCKIKTELAKQDWHVIFSNKSVEDCWCMFV